VSDVTGSGATRRRNSRHESADAYTGTGRRHRCRHARENHGEDRRFTSGMRSPSRTHHRLLVCSRRSRRSCGQEARGTPTARRALHQNGHPPTSAKTLHACRTGARRPKLSDLYGFGVEEGPNGASARAGLLARRKSLRDASAPPAPTGTRGRRAAQPQAFRALSDYGHDASSTTVARPLRLLRHLHTRGCVSQRATINVVRRQLRPGPFNSGLSSPCLSFECRSYDGPRFRTRLRLQRDCL